MSVVSVRVKDDEIVVGSDSILVTGFTQEKDKQAKLNKVNDMVIADVGDAQEGALFLVFCRTRKPRECSVDGLVDFMSDFQDWLNVKTGESTLNNQYIIVFEGKAFMMEGFFIKEVTEYTSIGAGMDFSLSALYLGHSVYESIKSACHLSIYCEEPINIIKISKNG